MITPYNSSNVISSYSNWTQVKVALNGFPIGQYVLSIEGKFVCSSSVISATWADNFYLEVPG